MKKFMILKIGRKKRKISKYQLFPNACPFLQTNKFPLRPITLDHYFYPAWCSDYCQVGNEVQAITVNMGAEISNSVYQHDLMVFCRECMVQGQCLRRLWVLQTARRGHYRKHFAPFSPSVTFTEVVTKLLVRVIACAVSETKCPILTALFFSPLSLSWGGKKRKVLRIA